MVLRDDSDAYWRRDIERRMAALEGAPQSGYQSITEGGLVVSQAGSVRLMLGIIDGRPALEVYDALGNPQIRAGELAAGGYGLEAIDGSGNALPIASLLFGIRANQVATSRNLADTAGAYADLPTSPGPAVTATVSETGRLLVLASASITAYLTNDARFGFALSGANTAAAIELGRLKPSDTTVATIAGIELMEGLNPGATTVTLKYRSVDSSPGGVAPNTFFNRNLVALPL